jgi:murein L,D-transpeptidase YcbB/YkuD
MRLQNGYVWKCRRIWIVTASALALATPLASCTRSPNPSDVGQRAGLGREQAEQALKVLADAPAHGFPPSAFPTVGLDVALKSADPRVRNAAQQRLLSELVAYARAQHGQAIPKAALDANWGVRSSVKYDAAADLRQALVGGRFERWLAALPPQDPQYERLRRGYLTYLKIAQAGGWEPVPAGRDLKPGSRDGRVAALRRRLALEDASLTDATAAAPYDNVLAGGVLRFQHRHGLSETGAADAATVAALNVPAIARAAQIRANLERLRWLPRETPGARIDVNSAAGTLQMYADGQPVMHMLVAAGKPGDETPILVSRIHTVVLNPSWNVPSEIAANELEPKGEAFLASHNFEHDGERLVQKPGAGNSLGRVKFQFDNPYAVYLHDTPAKATFSQPQRSVSHGCVRLEKAFDLARFLLQRDAGWPPQKLDEVLAGEETQSVALREQVPVRITYATAFAEGDQISFRDDVYGWDRETLEKLDAALARKT